MIRKLVALLLMVFVLALAIIPYAVYAESLKVGSSGSLVSQAQQRLKNWGYYYGSVDGIYGSKTRQAVIYFQQKNGLVADGIIGEKTAAALGINLSSGGTSSGGNYSSSSGSSASGDTYLLARLVYGEARGEPYRGMVAVAAVVLNRVSDSRFPNTIAGVIYQKGAFSVVSDGQINLAPDDQSLRAARDAMNGWDPSNGCIYYFNPAKTNNAFIWSRPLVVTIGDHMFCM